MKALISFGLAILAIGTIASGCGSSKSAQKSDADPAVTTWQRSAITIDGSDKDWTRPLPWSVKSENISYAVTNDNQNLYILMATSSPQEQQKIVQGGMTVWVNTKGDKSYAGAIGVGYPLDAHSDRDKNLMEEAQPQRKNNKPVTLEDKHDYQIYGFDNGQIPTYTYGDTNTQGIVMRMDYSNGGELIYEAAIPLQTLYPNHNPNSSYASKTVAVGFVIEGLLHWHRRSPRRQRWRTNHRRRRWSRIRLIRQRRRSRHLHRHRLPHRRRRRRTQAAIPHHRGLAERPAIRQRRPADERLLISSFLISSLHLWPPSTRLLIVNSNILS
ncbi:hypothetical protein ACQ86N_22320 [Puia sp. P3]|uniref:hypothetical protein n=1 Tax=Puia sp. P3 TaxID=3423952 RepID=UPI003D66E00E